MAEDPRATANRSISIGGNANGNIIQSGDGNTATLRYQQVSLPPPESVDIQSELRAIQEILNRLGSPDQRKIDNAVEEAAEEVGKPAPDKDEVGKALTRAMEYSKKAGQFAGVVDSLKPHVIRASSWLGENWHGLLGVLGLTV